MSDDDDGGALEARSAPALRNAFLLDCLDFVRALADCDHARVGIGAMRQLDRDKPPHDLKMTRCLDCGAIKMGSEGGWERTGFGQRAMDLDTITRSGGPISRALSGG